jgi:hypothetical protein
MIVLSVTPRHPLHRDELAALVRVHVVDGADVRVAQEGDGRGFAGEPPDRILIVSQLVREEFQRDLPRQLEVLGVVHDPHAPVPSLPGDAVMADVRPSMI